MIKVIPLTDKDEKSFRRLFTEYYTELGCDENITHLLDEYILPDILAGLIRIELLHGGEDFIGFVIYQIDDVDNEWNFKEGWGDIREIFVSPDSRRQGYGKFLLYTAEMKLRENGAVKSYCLPCAEAAPFFGACGYLKTDAYCDELDCSVYEKTELGNRCKG